MFRKKKVLVRILDTPIKMEIHPTHIITPIDGGKVMILFGDFKHLRDEDAYLLVQNTKTRPQAA